MRDDMGGSSETVNTKSGSGASLDKRSVPDKTGAKERGSFDVRVRLWNGNAETLVRDRILGVPAIH